MLVISRQVSKPRPICEQTMPAASAMLRGLSKIHSALRRPGFVASTIVAGGYPLGIHMAMFVCTATSAAQSSPPALSGGRLPTAAAMALTPALLHTARCLTASVCLA